MSKKLKILLIEPCPINFGTYFRALNIADGISQNGHQVDIIAPSSQKFLFRINYQSINPHLRLIELPRFYFNFYFNGRILRGLMGIFIGLFGKYDVFHAFAPIQLESNIPAIFFKLIGKKVVFDWDDDFSEGIFKDWPIVGQYVRFCEKNFPKFFQYYTVCTELLATKAKKYGVSQVLKIINGVNPHQFSLISRSQGFKQLKYDKKIVYLSSFGNTYVGQRGVLLLKCFTEVCRLDSNIKLIVNFDPLSVAKDLHVKLSPKVAARMINVGFIPPRQLGKYLSISSGSLFLMASTREDRSGFPIRVGTSLHGKQPIFTNNNHSEAANILAKYKCAILATGPKDLAAKTVETLHHPQIYQELYRHVLIARKELSNQKLGQQLVDFYQGI